MLHTKSESGVDRGKTFTKTAIYDGDDLVVEVIKFGDEKAIVMGKPVFVERSEDGSVHIADAPVKNGKIRISRTRITPTNLVE